MKLNKESSEYTMCPAPYIISKNGDRNTFDIKHIIEEFINRGGVIDRLEFRINKIYLEDILRTFSRETDLDFNIDVQKNFIDVTITNWRFNND